MVEQHPVRGFFATQLQKNWTLFRRRPVAATLLLVATPLFVAVSDAVDETSWKFSEGEGEPFDNCGLSLQPDFQNGYDPFTPAVLAIGPIVAGILASTFIQDEARSGMVQTLAGNRSGILVFWFAWWTLFVVLMFFSSIVGAGVAKAIPDFSFQRISFGAIFLSLFFLSVAILFGVSFTIQLIAGFRNRTGLEVILYIVLIGGYFLAALANLFSLNDGPNYFLARNTTFAFCDRYSVVDGDMLSCSNAPFCTRPLIFPNGDEHFGCWYEASSMDALWDADGHPWHGLQLFILFFFPTFHFMQMWVLMISTVILDGGSDFDLIDYFYASAPEIISNIIGLDAPIYTRSDQIFPSLTNTSLTEEVKCALEPIEQIPPHGVVGDTSKSYGASLGFLFLLAFAYSIGTLVVSNLRFSQTLAKRELDRRNSRMKPELKRSASTISSEKKLVRSKGSQFVEELVLERVDLFRGRRQVLSEISLTAKRGEITVFIGKNGNESTSLLKVIAGIETHAAGSIVTYPLPYFAATTGICLENDLLYNEITPEEHFAVWASLRKVAPDKIQSTVEKWLQSLNLRRHRHNMVARLPTGAKRRVAIGAATIGNPHIVVLDDPTSKLDAINSRFVWTHLEEVKHNSVVVISSSSTEEADTLGDTVLVLDEGRVIEQGSPFELKTKYGSSAQVSVFVQPDQLDSAILEIDQEVAHKIENFTLQVRTIASGELIVEFLRKEGVEKLEQPDLSPMIDWLECEGSLAREFHIANVTFDEAFLAIIKTKISQKTSTTSGSASGVPLQSIIKIDENEDDRGIFDAMEDRIDGLKLFWVQTISLTKKNFFVRAFQINAITKWFAALILLLGVTLVDATITEVQTDAVATCAVLSLMIALMVPGVIFELNGGFLQILKFSRTTSSSLIASEVIFVWICSFLSALISLSIFFAIVVTSGDSYKATRNFICFNDTSPCRCFVGENNDSFMIENAFGPTQERLSSVGTGQITNHHASFGYFLGFSLIFAIGATGVFLILTSIFKRRQVAAFLGTLIVLFIGLVPPLLVKRNSMEIFLLPMSWECRFLISPRADVSTPIVFERGETDCVRRRFAWDGDNVAANLFFTIGFFMSVTNFFFARITVTGNFVLEDIQSCSSDMLENLNRNTSVFLAGSLIAFVVGIFVFRLRTFSPKWFEVVKLKLREIKTCCVFTVAKKCTFVKNPPKPTGDVKFDDDIVDEEEEEDDDTSNLQECVLNELKKTQDLAKRIEAGEDVRDLARVVISGVSLQFFSSDGPVTVLKNINLVVAPGETLCILGASGSGKTSLLQLCHRSIHASRGFLFIDGCNVETDMGALYGKLGFVRQRDVLWKSLTPKQHLNLVCRLSGVALEETNCKRLITDVAARLGLDGVLDRKVSELSAGILRRLSVALILFMSPRLILLDEATSQMDTETKRLVWECVELFRARFQCSIIMATKNMLEAEELGDRIVILARGRMLAIDAVENLKNRFGNGFVMVSSVKAENRQRAFDFIREHICANAVVGNYLNGKLRIYFPRDGFDMRKATSALLDQEALDLIPHFQLKRASLHDVFMNLAGAKEATLEDIGYLSEAGHSLVVKLLRHRGLGKANHTMAQT